MIKSLNGMAGVELVGGFERKLAEKLTTGPDGKIFLYSTELKPEKPLRSVREQAETFPILRKKYWKVSLNF